MITTVIHSCALCMITSDLFIVVALHALHSFVRLMPSAIMDAALLLASSLGETLPRTCLAAEACDAIVT